MSYGTPSYIKRERQALAAAEARKTLAAQERKRRDTSDCPRCRYGECRSGISPEYYHRWQDANGVETHQSCLDKRRTQEITL